MTFPPSDGQPEGGPAGPEESEMPEQAPEIPPPPTEANLPELPEDLRVPWGWRDLAVFFAVALVSLIVLSNVLVAAMIIWLKVPRDRVVPFVKTSAGFNALQTVLWYAVLMLYLLIALRRRGGKPFWRTIGWRALAPKSAAPSTAYATCLLGGMALNVAVEFAAKFVQTKAKLPIEALFQDRQGVLWLMAVGVLLAPLVEETIFRGYLYPVLARSFGVMGGVIVTGILFGGLHAVQLWGGWGQIGLLMIVGIVLTYVRARTGSVTSSYLLHLGYNGFLFLGFYITTGGLRHLPHGP
jgi:membrane protease YdiL (CAAX protease family)